MIEDSSRKDSGILGPTTRPGYINQAYRPTENYSPKFSNVSKISLSIDDPKSRKESVLERVPHIDHYKVNEEDSGIDANALSRPTLRQLHQSKDSQAQLGDQSAIVNLGKDGDGNAPITAAATPSVNPVKFGWIIGVLMRCFLSIIGGMLFLRVSWVGAHAGSGFGGLIIVISSFVATLTALSMCAICTNGEVKAGGAYFMISRSLGPEFGGSVGIVFALANIMAGAMNIVGFAETCRDLMRDHKAKIIDADTNDIRIIGCAVLILLACIVLVGVDFEIKAQVVLLVVLTAALINYAVGTFLTPTLVQRSKGFEGYSWQLFSTNFVPHWGQENFFSIFAIYFPAATGIMAGANISGNLKDPSKSIPVGTLLSILLTTFVYLGVVFMTSASCVRNASGIIDELGNIVPCSDVGNTTGACQYGLSNYYQMMEMQSAFGPLITAGIFAATLSSALGCLISGPKLFQAVGRDKLYPKIDWFAEGYGKSDEPKRAYFLGFILTLAAVLIADLNYIAPYISNFYLATYALLNYACFHASTIKSTGWRPGFKYYNKWVSLAGAIICVAIMFLMGYLAAICTILFCGILYLYLTLKKPDVNWGTSKQAETYKNALENMHKLLYIEEHVKNYRPQILVMCGNPIIRPQMVDFVKSITKQKGLALLGHIVYQSPCSQYYKHLKNWRQEVYSWLRYRQSKAFYCPVSAPDLHTGLQTLLQTAGLGKLAPNIVLLGFKHDWMNAKTESVAEYFQLIHESFDCEMSLCILKVGNGIDCSRYMLEYEPEVDNNQSHDRLQSQNSLDDESQFDPTTPRLAKQLSIVREESEFEFPDEDHGKASRQSSLGTLNDYSALQNVRYRYESRAPDTLVPSTETGEFHYKIRKISSLEKEAMVRINLFQHRVKSPTIHVYWLFDDGGLTLLIPHILANNKTFLSGAKLHIFTLASQQNKLEEDEENMRTLLRKFRIEFADITIIPDMHIEPQTSTKLDFEKSIEHFRIMNSRDSNKDPKLYITDTELIKMKNRTRRNLRTRELLLQYSRDASLIVLTQPIPRKGCVSAYLYMAWLDFISRDLSPVLFVRGNHQSVLTFYS